MRILLLGDSHCRELQPVIRRQSSLSYTMIISVGSNTDAIAANYRTKVYLVNQFNPDVAIIHTGHNDMARHPSYNSEPEISTRVAGKTLRLANELHQNHPQLHIFISCTFPRTPTPSSILSSSEVRTYNLKVKRHGPRLRAMATTAGYHCLLNMCMWKLISRAEAEPKHLLSDGLHRTSTGQTALVAEWWPQLIKALTDIGH
jgi:lysophospholipase L1-like esterase